MILVIALNAGKDYLLNELGVFWVLVRVLACGGLAVMVWLVTSGQLHKKQIAEVRSCSPYSCEQTIYALAVVGARDELIADVSALRWTAHGTVSAALHTVCPYIDHVPLAIPTSPLRVILFTHFSSIWFKSLTNLSSVSPRPIFVMSRLFILVQVKQASAVLLALILSFLWDARFLPSNFDDFLPAYGALAVQALSSAALEHTEGVLSSTLGQSMTSALTTLGACMFSLPLYLLRHLLIRHRSKYLPHVC